METQVVVTSAVLLALLAACCSALPTGDSVLQSSRLSAEKRPKYMDTRDLNILKTMLLATIRDLVDEGQLNSAILPPAEDDSELKGVAKRMQYMGICMRRRQNTFIPYPCLRSGRR